jgi:hypothetical protein
MWKNTVKLGSPQMTIWHMRIACSVPEAKNTHLLYVMFIAFPQQQWLHEHASVLRYMYFVCLVILTHLNIRTEFEVGITKKKE